MDYRHADNPEPFTEKRKSRAKTGVNTQQLLGEQVEVRFGKKAIVYGKLLAFGNEGTFIIEEDDGEVLYCWPLLAIGARNDSRRTES